MVSLLSGSWMGCSIDSLNGCWGYLLLEQLIDHVLVLLIVWLIAWLCNCWIEQLIVWVVVCLCVGLLV